MLDEKKGTCCGRCGHVHVKGTSCPTPFLKGERHCSKRMSENLNELHIENPGVKNFIRILKAVPDAVKALQFPSLDRAIEFITGGEATKEDWTQLKRELAAYLRSKQRPELTGYFDETDHYCKECLIEYLLEYKDKIEEAEYRGRKVKLGKPFLTPGGPKKRSVYVKNAKGNVVKVNFGDPNMKIKKNIPARRKSFRARHKCDNPGPRWKARYWSCKHW